MASPTPARMTTAPAPSAAGTCDASMADGTNLFGPCILRHRHDGPVHKDSTGTRWALPDRSGDPVLASRSRELADLRDQLSAARTELAIEKGISADLRVESEARGEKLARFHEGEEPVTDERVEATPGQWIWRWNRATPDHRLQVVRDIKAAAALADRCFQGGHEARLDEQQARLAQLAEDVRFEREQREDLRRRLKDTSDAYGRVDEQRAVLAAALHDVLSHFVHPGHPGEPCLGAGWISVKTVAKWRAVLNPPATKEQP